MFRTSEEFRNLKNYIKQWEQITNNGHIFSIIKNGLKLDLIDTLKTKTNFSFLLSVEKDLIIKNELQNK